MKPPELLAPAGDAVCLTAALKAGADAVYFGVENFNMRRKARNFSLRDLPEIVRQCGDYGARSYLTLNTIVFEHELTALDAVVDAAKVAGVDAVIGWDPAVIRTVRRHDIEMHVSTQASVTNSAGIADYFRRYGIRRFVMARECSLSHLPIIRRSLLAELGSQADLIEIELFIHGALCVSMSGRCFLSEAVTGDSGNRGECLQPCRREYRILDVEGGYEFEIGRNYVMSSKDICTMPFFEKILASGAASLKIEGRMRNPEYVAIVTHAYRRAVDAWWKPVRKTDTRPGNDTPLPPGFDELKKELTEELKTVFNRGFHAGYYMGKPVNEWVEAPNSQAVYRKETVGTVVNFFRKLQVAEICIQGAGIENGDTLLIQGSTTGSLHIEVGEIRVNDNAVENALQGQVATVFVGERVRRGDAVFRRYAADISKRR